MRKERRLQRQRQLKLCGLEVRLQLRHLALKLPLLLKDASLALARRNRLSLRRSYCRCRDGRSGSRLPDAPSLLLFPLPELRPLRQRLVRLRLRLRQRQRLRLCQRLRLRLRLCLRLQKRKRLRLLLRGRRLRSRQRLRG